MKSIFEIHDGDSIEPEYSVGLWLQEQEAKIRLGLAAFDHANAGGALPGLQEAVDAEIRRRNESREDGARSEALEFFNEVLAESGVVVESVSVEALGDAVRLVGVAADGSPFEGAVPHRTVRIGMRPGLAHVVLDAIWCPLCGKREGAGTHRVCLVVDDEARLWRAVCGPCASSPRPLNQLDELQGVLRLLHALPTPAADIRARAMPQRTQHTRGRSERASASTSC